MKTLWNIISVIAVVNLLALGVFLAVLWQKKSLDGDRIKEAWSVLNGNVEELSGPPQASDDTAIEANSDPGAPAYHPLASGQEVRRIAHVNSVHAQARRRLGDERDMLIRQLESVSAELERRQIAFEEERAAWQSEIESQVMRKKDAQFQHAVKVLAALPAKQAKDILLEMIIQKGPDQGMKEATSYLNAMSIDTASRIIREMKNQDQTKVATNLLEHLRRFGLSEVEVNPNAEPNTPTATIPRPQGVGSTDAM